MIRRWFSSRMLWAALLALVLAVPPAALAPATMHIGAPADPGWLIGSLCLADGSQAPDDRRQPAAPSHIHCSLCLTGLAMLPAPEPSPLTGPSVTPVAHLPQCAVAWFGPGADRLYAARAPPIV